ncbi:hypothetical protein MOF32_30300, partial [Priestia megaterium]|uniref:hypothetical protein n=1 Tax=Priestia megaterium TaxID=1404 RepID=UPI0022805F4C
MQDILDSGVSINNLVVVKEIYNQGEMILAEGKNMGHMIGNSFGDGTVIQSEDVTQTITKSNPEVTNAYQELLEEIKKISDDSQRQQA